MKGSTHRRCYCRDPKTGKPLGKSCPKLSSRKHGSYSIRQELPPREDGTRRSFSRAGYETLKEAQADLDHVRALLGLAESDDPEALAQIAELLETLATEKAPLPNIESTRRRLSHGLDLISRLTVGEWLDMWLAGKKGRQSAISRDESNIRVHLKPRIGHLRLDRLRVSHLSEMFEAIAEANVEIAEGNAARRKAFEELARIPWKGREPRALRKAMKAAIAEMEPYRRIVGPATRQRVRSTLRAALNAAIAQQLITFNPASHVELEAGKRPKALVWTEERVLHWQRTGEKSSPVMVWPLPRPRGRRPPVRPVPPHRVSRAPTGRGVRAEVDRHSPGRGSPHRRQAACRRRLGGLRGRPQDRRGCTHHCPGRGHGRGPATTPCSAG